MARNKTEKQTVTAAGNRALCLEYRKEGLTYEQIGMKVGISGPAAWKHVTKALDDLRTQCSETADQLRTVEHQRLERQYNAAWEVYDIAKAKPHPGAMSQALETARKAGESIRKLYGLDSPEEHTHRLEDGATVIFELVVDGEPVNTGNGKAGK